MRTSLPKVSCICPTYNRISRNPLMLGEVMFWYLMQDYEGPKELIVLNDAPGQTLFTNLDLCSVRFVNVNDRYPTLGHKFNDLVRMSTGDIILPWEDDDISLPGRISQAVAALADGFDYWNPKGAFFQNGPQAKLTLCSPHSVHHNASAYLKSTWDRIGGYREDRYGGCRQDMFFDQDVRQNRLTKVKDGYLEPPDMTYVYRWGATGCKNLSSSPDPQIGWEDEPKPDGVTAFEVCPRIGRNYEQEAKVLVARSQLNPVAGPA